MFFSCYRDSSALLTLYLADPSTHIFPLEHLKRKEKRKIINFSPLFPTPSVLPFALIFLRLTKAQALSPFALGDSGSRVLPRSSKEREKEIKKNKNIGRIPHSANIHFSVRDNELPCISGKVLLARRFPRRFKRAHAEPVAPARSKGLILRAHLYVSPSPPPPPCGILPDRR